MNKKQNYDELSLKYTEGDCQAGIKHLEEIKKRMSWKKKRQTSKSQKHVMLHAQTLKSGKQCEGACVTTPSV